MKEQKGRIDILFANAGVGELVPLGAITEAHFDKTFSINVKGLLFTVQKALPLFQDGGSIILNASIVAPTTLTSISIPPKREVTSLTTFAHPNDVLRSA